MQPQVELAEWAVKTRIGFRRVKLFTVGVPQTSPAGLSDSFVRGYLDRLEDFIEKENKSHTGQSDASDEMN